MKNITAAILIVVAMMMAFIVGVGVSITGTLDDEAMMRNRVLSQRQVVEANFDKMWKVIEQQTQVVKVSKELQAELVESLVKGRSASFIKIVNESNPESAFSREQFVSLSNSIETQREEFLAEQVKLIDFDRYHRSMFDRVYSGLLLSFFNREPLDNVIVISSDRTKDVINTGLDNPTKLDL